MTQPSRIALGTMRFADKGMTRRDTVRLLEHCLDNGVSAMHVSKEYSSFELFCEAFKRLTPAKRREVSLIVKVASPHFSEQRFDATTLTSRIDEVLYATGSDNMAVAQWMWRRNPMDDNVRIPSLKEQSPDIIAGFAELISSGKVGQFGCFPYSQAFMEAASGMGICKLHINYLNLWEKPLLEASNLNDLIVLRPFGAGKVRVASPEMISVLSEFEDGNSFNLLQHSVRFLLASQRVKSVVFGVNRIEDMNEILSASQRCKKDEGLFSRYLNKVFGS